MTPILENLVCLACEALRLEDEYLRNALSSNQSYPSEKQGLLSINNERYYQFIIARHLFGTLKRRIALESNFIDLVVYSESNSNDYDIAIEMKRWMSSTGNQKIPGIREEFQKLEKTSAKYRLMLLFSSAPSSVSHIENINYLSKRLDLNIDPSRWSTHSFETAGIKGTTNKFYVSGYEVKKN